MPFIKMNLMQVATIPCTLLAITLETLIRVFIIRVPLLQEKKRNVKMAFYVSCLVTKIAIKKCSAL